MDLSNYTTQQIEFITSNLESFKKELKKRYKKELDNFLFNVGDVIYSKHDDDIFLIKIKEIDKRYYDIVGDKIVIRRDGGLFDVYVDERYDVDTTEWYEYVKIEDSKIFENLLDIIDQYNYDAQSLIKFLKNYNQNMIGSKEPFGFNSTIENLIYEFFNTYPNGMIQFG